MKNTIEQNVGKYNNQTGLRVDGIFGGYNHRIFILDYLLTFTNCRGEDNKSGSYYAVRIYDKETAARINADKLAGRGYRFKNEWINAVRDERTEKSLADYSKETFEEWQNGWPQSKFYKHDFRAEGMFWDAFNALTEEQQKALVDIVNGFGYGESCIYSVQKPFESVADFRERAIADYSESQWYGAYDVTQQAGFASIDEWLCKVIKKHERFSKYNYVKAGSLYAYERTYRLPKKVEWKPSSEEFPFPRCDFRLEEI